MLPHLEKIELKSGEVLFEQGDISDYLYIVISGQLMSLLNKPNGEVVALGTISAFETIGELGAISGELRSSKIEAVIDCALFKMPSDQFREMCEKHHNILSKFQKL